MEEIKEKLLEKSINFWIRNVLRLMAWVILLFYMIFRIISPVINHERIVLDFNDGWVILACMALLLAIEGVRAFVKRKMNDK